MHIAEEHGDKDHGVICNWVKEKYGSSRIGDLTKAHASDAIDIIQDNGFWDGPKASEEDACEDEEDEAPF